MKKYELFSNPDAKHIIACLYSEKDFDGFFKITCKHCKSYIDIEAKEDSTHFQVLTEFVENHIDCIDTSLN